MFASSVMLLALEGLCTVPYQYIRHVTTKYEGVVRLADGTTWHNAIVVCQSPQLRKQILRFFSAAITRGWGMGDIRCELGL